MYNTDLYTHLQYVAARATSSYIVWKGIETGLSGSETGVKWIGTGLKTEVCVNAQLTSFSAIGVVRPTLRRFPARDLRFHV